MSAHTRERGREKGPWWGGEEVAGALRQAILGIVRKVGRKEGQDKLAESR